MRLEFGAYVVFARLRGLLWSCMRLLNFVAAAALCVAAVYYLNTHSLEADAMSAKIRLSLTQILHKSAGIWDARITRKNVMWGH